jgi:hypothetical protein
MDTTVAPLASIGVDIGKEVFHLVGFGTDGKIAFRRKIKRLALIESFKKLAPCVVGMEACLSAHFVSRTLRKLGHGPNRVTVFQRNPVNKSGLWRLCADDKCGKGLVFWYNSTAHNGLVPGSSPSGPTN